MANLRDYQIIIIEETRELMKRGVKRILIQSPTGSGKTTLTAHMLKSASAKGVSCWFINHRRELISQGSAAFNAEGLDHGIIAADLKQDTTKLVQIASIQTLINRHHKYPSPKLIIWDECQHLSAGSWQKIFQAYPDAFQIGLTATPVRADRQGLGKFFDVMVKGPSVTELIKQKYLSDYKLFAPFTPDTSHTHTRMGDYVRSELEGLMGKSSITGNAISEYKKHANNKRAIVFCVSVAHSEFVSAAFNEAGIISKHLDGNTPSKERDEIMNAFRRDEIKVITNCELFSEGLDVPGIECVILMRPTQSLGLHLQQVGRGLRPSADKSHAIILDHAGNTLKHGLPDDDREWILTEGKDAVKNIQEVKLKLCPECFAANQIFHKECKYCGHIFQTEKKSGPLEVDGELKEMTKEMIQKIQKEKRNSQASCRTYEALLAHAVKYKFKYPSAWAKRIWAYRHGKKY